MTPAWITLVALAAGTGEVPVTGSFESPVELQTGARTFAFMTYPSPAVFDLDGDGTDELYVGDLFGYVHAAERDGAGWGKATKVKDAGGNDLKFDNW